MQEFHKQNSPHLESTLYWQAIYILHPNLGLRATVFALQLLVEPEVRALQLAYF